MSCSFRYVGDAPTVRAIAQALEYQRTQLPAIVAQRRPLTALRQDAEQAIDWNLFDDVVRQAVPHFRKLAPHFTPIPQERYFIAHPEPGNLGGFFGQPTGGYYYLNDVGFSTLFDPERVQNRTLRTLELARNYLHDSLHACTFKTFRMDARTGVVFRHQYGINFRDERGNSYSSPDANAKSPETVNLNAWMDAVTHTQVTNFMRDRFARKLAREPLNPLEREIAHEMCHQPFDREVFSEPCEFYRNIMTPVQLFMDKWGKEALLDSTLHAMLTGEIAPLKDYFARQCHDEHAWETMFRQSAYRDPDTQPDVAPTAAASGAWRTKSGRVPASNQLTVGG